MRKLITILTPAYNEEAALPHFHRELSRVVDTLTDRYDFEFLWVNDGSADSTLDVMKRLRGEDPRIRIVDLSRNYGKETGMLAGFDHASGDAVITIDADLQEPPSVIPAMLEKWEEGYMDVYGRRRSSEQSRKKRFTSRLYHRLLANISDVEMSDDAGDFRLLDRRCVDALCRMRESQRYTKGMYDWIGFSKTSVDFDVAKRVAGKSKFTFGKLMHLAADGIMAHSVMPLRMASYAGIFVSLTAFVFLIYVVIKAMIHGDPVAGYPSQMAVILFLGGSVLLALGIIGEYLGRIYLETKRRPIYFTNETPVMPPRRREETTSHEQDTETDKQPR